MASGGAVCSVTVLTSSSLDRLHQTTLEGFDNDSFDDDSIAEVAEPAPNPSQPTARQSYELSAIQAHCWLRQLLVSDCASELAISDSSSAIDDETQAQLEAMFEQFAQLTASETAEVQPALRPESLSNLRARQRAVSACLSEAASLAKRRAEQRALDQRATLEALDSCHRRLRLVARCAIGLARSRRRGRRRKHRRLTSAAAAAASTNIERDISLLEDSAARARRNIGELLDCLDAAKLERRASQQLRACAGCLTVRAEGLAAFAEWRRRVEGEGEGECEVEDTGKDVIDELLRKVAASVADAVARTLDVSLEPQKLASRLRELELAEHLVNQATIACDEAAERAADGCSEDNDSDSDDNRNPNEESIENSDNSSGSNSSKTTPEAAAHECQHRRQKQQLSDLQASISAAKRPLSQLSDALSKRAALHRQLSLRTLRLRHLAELAKSAEQILGGREAFGDHHAFLDADETEATEPTTPELLADVAKAMASLDRQSCSLARALAKAAKASNASEEVDKRRRRLEGRLRALTADGERRLAAAESARLELKGPS